MQSHKELNALRTWKQIGLSALAFAFVLFLMTGLAGAEEAEVYTYTLNSAGDSYTVSGYAGNEASVTVPDWYDSMPVTAIGDGAFQGNTTITSVALPSTITRIGASAFKDCTNLTTITTYTASETAPETDDEFVISTAFAITSVNAGDTAVATYTVTGHSCDEAVYTLVWEVYDANGGMLDAEYTDTTECAGSSSYVPREGDLLVFTVNAACSHVTCVAVSDEIAINGGLSVVLTVEDTAVQIGKSISVTYVIEGGLAPYTSITVTGYTVDSATGETTAFLTATNLTGSGTQSGVPETGDQLYFELVIVESDGRQTTWQTDVLELAPAADASRLPGDADDNGVVDIYDGLVVLQYGVSADTAINLSNADVNADGEVNIHDALLILQYDAGWAVTLK